MQTVIVIKEENHGMIGIAKDYKNAIYFLIDNDWLWESSEIFYNEDWCPINLVFGEHWQDKTLALDFNKFCELFDGCFYLREEEIFEKPLDKQHKV